MLKGFSSCSCSRQETTHIVNKKQSSKNTGKNGLLRKQLLLLVINADMWTQKRIQITIHINSHQTNVATIKNSTTVFNTSPATTVVHPEAEVGI